MRLVSNTLFDITGPHSNIMQREGQRLHYYYVEGVYTLCSDKSEYAVVENNTYKALLIDIAIPASISDNSTSLNHGSKLS